MWSTRAAGAGETPPFSTLSTSFLTYLSLKAFDVGFLDDTREDTIISTYLSTALCTVASSMMCYSSETSSWIVLGHRWRWKNVRIAPQVLGRL